VERWTTSRHEFPRQLGFAPSKIKVTFQVSSDTFKVAELVWISPPGELDAAVLRLADIANEYPCCSIAYGALDQYALRSGYLIGHPDAGELSLSLQNNGVFEVTDPMLRYTAATKPGSSGSAVFDDAWNVVGVHHGMRSGSLADGTPYVANEATAHSISRLNGSGKERA
jgi:Trypsin-like peptidase domain